MLAKSGNDPTLIRRLGEVVVWAAIAASRSVSSLLLRRTVPVGSRRPPVEFARLRVAAGAGFGGGLYDEEAPLAVGFTIPFWEVFPPPEEGGNDEAFEEGRCIGFDFVADFEGTAAWGAIGVVVVVRRELEDPDGGVELLEFLRVEGVSNPSSLYTPCICL